MLKVGKVCVKCDPPLFTLGMDFKQTLDLESGSIIISSTSKNNSAQHATTISVFIDANNPVINVTHNSSKPVILTASIELWRREPKEYGPAECSDLLENTLNPNKLDRLVTIEPDTIVQGLENQIGWFHHNKKSEGFEVSNKIQGLGEYFKSDPILHRTFGGLITGSDVERVNDTTLRTKATKQGNISVHVLTTHPSTPEQWLTEIQALAEKTDAIAFEPRQVAHQDWWKAFWERSWINITESSDSDGNDAFLVARSYALQRFIDACAGRGKHPIKFNGSIFTAPYKGDPDFRRWGPGYWWQNTRLPYLSMCASGDFDLMQPLFKMYVDDILEVNKFRTKKYLGHGGAFYPECIYFWGSTFVDTYGWTPFEEREDKLQESPWHKWEWVAGPELVFMMFDYYDYTQDELFLKEKLLPLAIEVLRFFDEHYKTDDNGELVMHPAMACETWWECTNPMPELAGLHALTKRLLALSDSQLEALERDFYSSLQKKLPPLPTRLVDDKQALAPATIFEDKIEDKKNFENPELYAVFPFRLCSFEKENVELGREALTHRWDRGAFGWRQDDIFMAYLGLADEAQSFLVDRCKNNDENSRFPAFWGPNYDWVPDQDHGGVLTKTLQAMILQSDPYSRKIYVAPAWPKNWNCEFKLHAPYKTIIEAKVINGEVVDLKVTPESRRKDVVIL